jgi:hypothetical protein
VSFPWGEPDSEPLPTLTLEIVEDDVALAEAVDALVGADLDARERMLEIFRYAEALRAALDADTWRLFLLYDERANGRFSELLLVTARFAFSEGRKYPNAEPES